ncbi:MAG: carboxypeptidase regulatory-like domain-containing protein [Thermoanaerobaculales bacterium]
MKRFAILALFALPVSLPAFAQMPTGTLSGHATDGTEALPGVTVTVTSPSMQGTRTTVTGASGDYIFTFLPPGEYHVKFELQDFETIETTVRLNAAQTQRLDATMPQAKIAEKVTVTGTADTIQAQDTASTSMDHDLVYKLPVAKDMDSIAALSAGVFAWGTAYLIISGGTSSENQLLVNGAPVMFNSGGNPAGLYIEDAVQETTTSVSGISAEYGRFTGGVVNMLTKSGGNDFHASLRDTLTSDKWTAISRLQTSERNSTINNYYEGTLGGFIVKDRLWFFLAGRDIKTSRTGETDITDISYPMGADEQRYEGKLTFAVNPNHRIIGSYLKVDHTTIGTFAVRPMDLNSLYDQQTPNDLTVVNYTGVLTDNFFVEGQYSKKTVLYEDLGSRYTDLARGTPIVDENNFSNTESYNSPTGCAVCANSAQHRDNQDIFAKASWFLSSEGAGSHNIVLGYDRFDDKPLSNNWQSGSSYWLFPDGEAGYVPRLVPGASPGLDPNGSPYPVFISNSGSSYVFYAPIADITPGDDYRTESLFLNDKWRLNNNFSFNIGLRYDKNHGVNGAGAVVSNDSNISPRLGVTYDPTGNGKWQFSAGYAKYVAAINSVASDVSAAGQPASLWYLYAGPDINATCNPANAVATGCISAWQAAQEVLTWFQGLSQAQQNALVAYAYVPGYSLVVKGSLKSPNVQETTIGATTRLGSRGEIRLDYVHRKYADFYATVTNTSTAQSQPDPYGNVYDMTYLENSNASAREYNGVHVSGEYRLTDAFQLGGNYTWSTLRGNDGGKPCCGEVFGDLAYPEYKAYPQFSPVGYLSADQRNRVRVFGVFDILNTTYNRLSVSLMETYASGIPYSAVGYISIQPYVTNPGYLNPPSSTKYYFSPRGAFRMDSLNSTDLSFNYAFVIPSLGTGFQFFLEPRVTNVFNNHAVVNVNTTVYTSRTAGKGLSPFNPFTTKPVECPQNDTAAQCQAMDANWQLGPAFGAPQTATTAANTTGDFQMPRTLTVSFGVRF